MPRPRQTRTTSKLEEPVEAMKPQTSSPSAEPVTASSTKEEQLPFADFSELELILAELCEELQPSNGPIVLGSACLEQVSIGKEGGFLITLDVSELDRREVARLMGTGKKVFNVVLAEID